MESVPNTGFLDFVWRALSKPFASVTLSVLSGSSSVLDGVIRNSLCSSFSRSCWVNPNQVWLAASYSPAPLTRVWPRECKPACCSLVPKQPSIPMPQSLPKNTCSLHVALHPHQSPGPGELTALFVSVSLERIDLCHKYSPLLLQNRNSYWQYIRECPKLYSNTALFNSNNRKNATEQIWPLGCSCQALTENLAWCVSWYVSTHNTADTKCVWGLSWNQGILQSPRCQLGVLQFSAILTQTTGI